MFYHDEEQLKQAKDSLKKEASKRSGEIRTEILEFKGFTVAEDYHQKFRLRSEGLLMDELVSIYPDSSDFMNSTAVARINGYLGGYGTPEDLSEELGDLGLSYKATKRLIDILSKKRPAFKSCPIPAK